MKSKENKQEVNIELNEEQLDQASGGRGCDHGVGYGDLRDKYEIKDLNTVFAPKNPTGGNISDTSKRR